MADAWTTGRTRQYLQARGAQTPTYNYYPTYVRWRAAWKKTEILKQKKCKKVSKKMVQFSDPEPLSCNPKRSLIEGTFRTQKVVRTFFRAKSHAREARVRTRYPPRWNHEISVQTHKHTDLPKRSAPEVISASRKNRLQQVANTPRRLCELFYINFIARSAYYFRSEPFEEMSLFVCDSRDFVILPKGIWALDRVQFSSVLWPGKRVTYFSGPKSYPQLRTFKGYRTTVRGSENWTIFLDTFCTFFASKSQFFSCRTSSHVSWIVIIRWRLRAPCLQVLSSFIGDSQGSWWTKKSMKCLQK